MRIGWCHIPGHNEYSKLITLHDLLSQIGRIYMSKDQDEKMGVNLFTDVFSDQFVESVSLQMTVLSSSGLGVLT